MSNLVSFRIEGLFGSRNVEVDLKKDFTILIGENGFGKTVMLTIVAYLFQGKFEKLKDFDFETVQLTFTDANFTFKRSDLEDYYFLTGDIIARVLETRPYIKL